MEIAAASCSVKSFLPQQAALSEAVGHVLSSHSESRESMSRHGANKEQHACAKYPPDAAIQALHADGWMITPPPLLSEPLGNRLRLMFVCVSCFRRAPAKGNTMDKLDNYRVIVGRLIEEYASYKPAYANPDEAIVDREHDH